MKYEDLNKKILHKTSIPLCIKIEFMEKLQTQLSIIIKGINRIMEEIHH